MEPLFEVRNALTEDMMREFHRAQLSRRPLHFLVIVGGMQIAVGVLRIVWLLLRQDSADGISRLLNALAPGLVWILPGIAWLAVTVYVPRAMVNRRIRGLRDVMAASYGIRFYAEDFVQEAPAGELRIAYPALRKIVETRSLLMLYQEGEVSIVQKSGFTRGTPEELLTYLRSVCPATYKRLRM